MRVLSKILGHIGDELQVDDIERVFAVRFSGVFCDFQFREAVSRAGLETPRLVKRRVSLYDENLPGTHAYEVYLFNGDVWNIPVWS